MNGRRAERLLRMVFLGTGTSQGVPIIGCSCSVCTSNDPHNARLRSSVMLEGEAGCVVVDTGPDFRAQMLRECVKRLDAVVYTHEHKDHLAGMDDVRPFNYLQKNIMPLFASDRVEAALKRDFHYAFEKKSHGGVPQVDIRRIEDFERFEAGGLSLEAFPVMHGELPIHGFRCEDVAYITDANHLSLATLARLQDLDVLVLNALRPSPHYSHFSLEEAVEVSRKIGARQTFFTHVSHEMGDHVQVNKGLPAGMALAHDGLVLERADGQWSMGHSDWLVQTFGVA